MSEKQKPQADRHFTMELMTLSGNRKPYGSPNKREQQITINTETQPT